MRKSKPEIEAFREAYRGGQVDAPSGPCPQDEELAALVLGELRGPERTELADHVVRCPNCRESYRLLRDVHREAGAKRRPSPPAYAWLSAAAALVVLITGAALLRTWLPPIATSEDDLRGPDAVLELTPPDGAPLPDPPGRLAWPSRMGAVSYHVRLFQPDAQLLWERVEGLVSIQPENSAYDLFGHRLSGPPFPVWKSGKEYSRGGGARFL